MSIGPLMIDLQGTAINQQEHEWLCHPAVGGVILFTRNYQSREQLIALIQELHEIKKPKLLIAVDQEGGRVQRLRQGFTEFPPMRALGEVYDHDPQTIVLSDKFEEYPLWLFSLLDQIFVQSWRCIRSSHITIE